MQSRITVFNSAAGHSDGRIDTTAGIMVLFGLIILILMTIYMIVRVYVQKKYFSKDYIKKFGESKWTAIDM